MLLKVPRHLGCHSDNVMLVHFKKLEQGLCQRYTPIGIDEALKVVLQGRLTLKNNSRGESA
jgi:hypothetical protein